MKLDLSKEKQVGRGVKEKSNESTGIVFTRLNKSFVEVSKIKWIRGMTIYWLEDKVELEYLVMG